MAQNSEKWSAPLEFLAPIYPVSRFSAAEVQFLARVACTACNHKARGISASQLSLTLNFGVLGRLWQRDLPLASRRNREAACVVLLLAVASCHAVRFNCVRDFAESVSGAGKPFEDARMPYTKAADLCTFANWLDVGVKYVQERDERSLRLLRNVCVRLVRGDATTGLDLGGATDAEFDALMDYMLRPRPVLVGPGVRGQLQEQRERTKKEEDDDDENEDGGDCNDSRTTSPTTMPATPDSSADNGHATEDSTMQTQQQNHRDKKPRQHARISSSCSTTTSQRVRAAPQLTTTTTTALSSERFHRTSDRSPKRPRVSAGFAEFVSARIVPPV